MLRDLFEDEIQDTPEITDTQKKVLVKIKCASTPKVAFEDVSKDQNEIAARDMLKDMNLIDVVDNSISINDTGIQAMQDEGLTDESGEVLPDIKQKYLNGDEAKNSEEDMAGGPVGGDEMGPQDGLPPPAPNSMQTGQPSQNPPMGEGYTLMRQIRKEAGFFNNR